MDAKRVAAMGKPKTMTFSERFPPQVVFPFFDVLAIFAGGWLAHWMRFGSLHLHERYVLALICIGLLVLVINSMSGSYRRWRITPVGQMLGKLLLVWVAVGITAASLIYFAHAANRYSRLWIGLTLAVSFLVAGGARLLVQLALQHVRLRGGARRPVFLIGPATNVLGVAEGIRSAAWEGHTIAGVERIKDQVNEECIERIVRRISRSNAREVWICVPFEMGHVVRSLFFALRNHTAEVRFIPAFEEMHLLNHRMSEVAGHYAIDLSVSPMSGMSRFVKRSEDIIIGTLISIMILPVCLGIALAIKLTSPGPILFKQHREGSNGRRFKVYKFRSMRVHQEEAGQVTQAKKNDSRITPIGAFLRRTSLDELPQFYNVLQGRMSIVGPRPHALAHNEQYKELVESYMRRHKVKPGITGWAQVNGLRGETDTLQKMQRRVEYDLWYIDNWSLWLDLKIIVLTVFKGFINKNAY